LRAAGLVQARRDGSTVYYSLADERVIEAYRLIQAIAG
jgi:DNA-binding transcriptional ArsR family regulator